MTANEKEPKPCVTPEEPYLRCMVGCLLRVLALTLLLELATFKLATLIFVGYGPLQSIVLLAATAVLLVLLALLGLLDETLFVFLLLVALFFLLPGTQSFIDFYAEHVTTLLIHLWIPLYFCRDLSVSNAAE